MATPKINWPVVLKLVLAIASLIASFKVGEFITTDEASKDDPEFAVKLIGPSNAMQGFAVVVDAPADSVKRWRNQLPAGEQPALELTDNAGRLVLANFAPLPGEHIYELSAQKPVDGLDPFAESRLRVFVGAEPQPTPAPPKVDPVKPDAPVPVVPATKVTSVTYVYEKDDGGVPSAVMAGLNRLNREKGIRATVAEDDITDGDGDVPDQYKTVFTAAKAAGLPALVVLSGETVVRTVKAPTTEAAVWEAGQ